MSIIPSAFQFPQNGPQLTQEDTPFLSPQTEGYHPQVPCRLYNLSLPTEQFSPLTMNPTATVPQPTQRKILRARQVSLTIFNYFQLLSNVFQVFQWILHMG
jgi:hypothetical protein